MKRCNHDSPSNTSTDLPRKKWNRDILRLAATDRWTKIESRASLTHIISYQQ